MSYVDLVILIAAGAGAIGVVYGGHHVIFGDTVQSNVSILPFLSGGTPAEHALSRYHARWYAATLIFLAFDVEMLFMYPWATVVMAEGGGAIVEMFAFLGVLMVAVMWAWREGAFRWA